MVDDATDVEELVARDAGAESLLLMAKSSSFVVEGQGCAVVLVHRLGSGAAGCEVDFTTKGLGHANFSQISGTLAFAAGESEQRIRIPLVNDTLWEPMERFLVTLTAARGAALGQVNETLVHIVDDETYPANLPHDASEWHLLYAFWRERWRHRWPKPIKAMLFKTYDSAHNLFGTYFPVICVEIVVVRRSNATLAALGGLYALSSLLNWYCAYKFQDLRGNSGTRKDWRNWLIKRFVWLGEERHLQVDPMRWFHTVSNDVDEAVKKCWHEHYILANSVVDIVLQLGFGAAILGWIAIAPLLFVIPTLLVVLWCAWHTLVRRLDRRYDAEDTWMHYVMDHATNWMLTMTNEMRDESSVEFEKRNGRFYKAHRKARFLELHMVEAPQLASEIGLALIVVGGAMMFQKCTREIAETGSCASSGMTYSIFFTNIKVYQRVGKKAIAFCRSTIKITRGLSALRRVTDTINIPLGIEHHMDPRPTDDDLASVQEKKTKGGLLTPRHGTKGGKERAAKRAATVAPGPGSDRPTAATDEAAPKVSHRDGLTRALTQIRLEDVFFAFEAYPSNKAVAVLRGVTAEFELGKLHMLRATAPETETAEVVSSTLSTLLRICAGHLAPTAGTVLTPGYLKVRYVPQEPLIFNSTLMKNLVPTSTQTKCSDEQIWTLAHAVGLSDHLVGQPDYRLGSGGLGIKLVDRQLVCIMRAMLCDPDVLLLCKPGASMKPAHSARLYRVLAAWVDGGGLDGVTCAAAKGPGAADSKGAKAGGAAALGDEELVRRVAQRKLRTVICSTDESMVLPDPSNCSLAGTYVAKTLEIGQSTGKSNWRELKSVWKASN